ncbi:hypothetical protein AB0K93_32645 [Streptomyces sp. NPDC052676]|uniref:hypothetical protein n=1 Tax=Streptomyces sp. NPDC052676 TaxID=3154953 RepID=UPI00342C9204
MTRLKPSSVITEPVRFTGSALRRMPGMDKVSKAAEGTLDAVGVVSPRGRRIAVYTGAGLLGAAGVVEWPVAIAGAAVAWLTQPRPGPEQAEGKQGAGQASPTEGAPARATAGAASRTAASGGSTASMATGRNTGESPSGGRTPAPGTSAAASGTRATASPGRTTVSGARTKTVHGTGTTTIKAATAHRRTAARRHTATTN